MIASTSNVLAESTLGPAVVRSGNSVSLADHLDLRNLPLATTPGGKNFAIKALHPADPEIRTTRLPGTNRSSTAILADMIETIVINNPGDYVRIVSMSSPIAPCTVVWGPTEGSMSSGHAVFGNTAFGGTFVNSPTASTYELFENRFRDVAELYRVTAQSITCELVAPALSNQGSVVCGQVAETPQVFKGTKIASYGTLFGPTDCFAPLDLYDAPPRTSQLLLGSNAYSGEARAGCYSPLKLTDLAFRSTNNPHCSAGSVTGITVPQYSFNFNPSSTQIFPYPGNTANGTSVAMFPKWSCPNYSLITFSGMAAAVGIRIRVRQVLEIVPYPGTVYAGAMENALPPDDLSVRMYHEISGKMKDAYPASYNDLGKLKDVISTLAYNILPFVDPVLSALSFAPGPVGAIAKIARPFASGLRDIAGNAIQSSKKNKKKKSKASLPAPSKKKS